MNSRLLRNVNDYSVLGMIIYVAHRVVMMLYAKIKFNRTDIRIPINATIGDCKYISIGKGFSAGRNLRIDTINKYMISKQVFNPKVVIGDMVSVGDYVHIGCVNKISIGNNVLMGSHILISDHNHGVYCGEYQDGPNVRPIDRCLTEGKSVVVGDRCWIGEFVIILPGVTIGEGCIIGSHSTVTHDIPANTIAVGSPARLIKRWDDNRKQWIKCKRSA